MQSAAVVPREALDIDIQHNGMVIDWKGEDFQWLKFFQKYTRMFPDDVLSKRVYRNYRRWYRSN